MTEREAIKSVVEKSITTKVDIEELRKWLKYRYEYNITCRKNTQFNCGEAYAYLKVIQKLDELEA